MSGFSRRTLRWLENRASAFLLRCLPTPAKPLLPSPPNAVLVVKSCCLGDALLSLYALRAFKAANPQTRIEVLASRRIEAVYRLSPDVDCVHTLPVTGLHTGREMLNPMLGFKVLLLARKLRRGGYDWLIDLELYRSFGAVLARYLRVSHSRGFAVPGAPDKPHDDLVHRGKADPEWKCFYAVFGLPVPIATPPPLFPRESFGIRKSLSQERRIGLVYGASGNWPQKRWPIEHFATLGSHLAARGHRIVLFGSADERQDGETLLKAIPGSESTVGQLDLAGLLEKLAACDLVVGNDTGTLHAAAAVGVRCVTLFGPTSPAKWNALTSRPVYRRDLPCRPCYYLSSMPDCSHRNCLTQLSPHEVASAVLEELHALPPSADKSDEFFFLSRPIRDHLARKT